MSDTALPRPAFRAATDEDFIIGLRISADAAKE